MAELVIGVDEAGRGSWAGPIIAAAVVFPTQSPLANKLADSKKLTPKRRSALVSEILAVAPYSAIAACTANTVDEVGINLCNHRVMKKAALLCKAHYLDTPTIFDGSMPIHGISNSRCEPKADDKYPAVSAASILAKVYRDLYMDVLAKEYPEYGWDSNKGYGAVKHKKALEEHGISPFHRKSFRPVNLLLESV